MAINLQDSNGQWWQLGVDTAGRTTWTAIATPIGGGGAAPATPGGGGPGSTFAFPFNGRVHAGDIFATVRALVDDPSGDYATDDYQAPLLNLAQKSMVTRFHSNPNIGKYKSTIVLANVPSGTTSLAGYFEPGQPLELLTEIFGMKEKPTGQTDDHYTPLAPMGEPPTLPQGSLNRYYFFNEADLILPGATQALDLRIFGEFEPAAVKDKDSSIIPGASVYLEFMTAALVARAHGNRDLAKDYADSGDKEIFAMMNNAIMELQSTPTRQVGFGDYQF